MYLGKYEGLICNVSKESPNGAVLITGMRVGYIGSMLSIRFLMEYVRKHDFAVFGWYRVVVGVLVILYFAIPGAAVY